MENERGRGKEKSIFAWRASPSTLNTDFLMSGPNICKAKVHENNVIKPIRTNKTRKTLHNKLREKAYLHSLHLIDNDNESNEVI